MVYLVTTGTDDVQPVSDPELETFDDQSDYDADDEKTPLSSPFHSEVSEDDMLDAEYKDQGQSSNGKHNIFI